MVGSNVTLGRQADQEEKKGKDLLGEGGRGSERIDTSAHQYPAEVGKADVGGEKSGGSRLNQAKGSVLYR